METLINLIMDSEQMMPQEKVQHILTIMEAEAGFNTLGVEGLYLKVINNDNGLDLQLWYCNSNETGDTQYSKEQILNIMHQEYLKKERQNKR